MTKFKFDDELSERNHVILSMYEEDPNISKIARTFGISLTRVKQVLDRAGVRMTKEEGSAGQYHGYTTRYRDGSSSGGATYDLRDMA
jgi:hypothetical protein